MSLEKNLTLNRVNRIASSASLSMLRNFWGAAMDASVQRKRLVDRHANRILSSCQRRFSVYKNDGTGWLKIKDRSYSQAEGRHELLTQK